MDIRPIRTEADYRWALAEVKPYFDREPAPGTPESDRFEVLATLIEAYEDLDWAPEMPDPIEALRHYMELRSFTQTDLATVLGSRSAASQLLAGKRAPSLAQIRALHAAWGIPADLLIQVPVTAAA